MRLRPKKKKEGEIGGAFSFVPLSEFVGRKRKSAKLVS